MMLSYAKRLYIRLPVLVMPGQGEPLDDIERADQADAQYRQDENRGEDPRRVE
jgi:hypothetical protein